MRHPFRKTGGEKHNSKKRGPIIFMSLVLFLTVMTLVWFGYSFGNFLRTARGIDGKMSDYQQSRRAGLK